MNYTSAFSCKSFILAFCLVVFFHNCVFSQNLAEQKSDSITHILEKKQMVYSKTKIAHPKNSAPSISLTEKFDKKGNRTLAIKGSGRNISKGSYEYDSTGKLVRTTVYYNADTSVVEGWITYGYDSASRLIKRFEQNPGRNQLPSDTSKHLIVEYKYLQEGKCTSQSTYHYSAKDTTMSKIRYCADRKNFYLKDHISYDKNKSIKEVDTWYSVLDDQARLTEYGQIKYDSAIMAYMGNNPEFTINVFTGKSMVHEMILDRKFKGILDRYFSYTYDSLGNISSAVTISDSVSYSYNVNGQILEETRHYQNGSSVTKYTYDNYGLLIYTDNIVPNINYLFRNEFLYEYYK